MEITNNSPRCLCQEKHGYIFTPNLQIGLILLTSSLVTVYSPVYILLTDLLNKNHSPFAESSK